MNGPLFMTTLSIFVHSLEEWKANKLIFLKRLVLLAHLRSTSPAPVETYVVKSFHPAFVNFSELACIKNKLFVVLKASGFSYFFTPWTISYCAAYGFITPRMRKLAFLFSLHVFWFFVSRLSSNEVKGYEVYKPVLMYFQFVDRLHHLCKVSIF